MEEYRYLGKMKGGNCAEVIVVNIDSIMVLLLNNLPICSSYLVFFISCLFADLFIKTIDLSMTLILTDFLEMYFFFLFYKVWVKTHFFEYMHIYNLSSIIDTFFCNLLIYLEFQYVGIFFNTWAFFNLI